jgi:hypothetical protein
MYWATLGAIFSQARLALIMQARPLHFGLGLFAIPRAYLVKVGIGFY